jgi:hypothetical protein
MCAIPLRRFPKTLLGKWVSTFPWDGDDYRSEYEVFERDGSIDIRAMDLDDGEEFEISDITWDGEWLRFRSLMPSTGRAGLNEFRLIGPDRVETRFTFTVIEELCRPRK